MGHTPLALACGTHATEGSLKVARVLAAGGASVHTVDRFGDPMMWVVMARPDGADRYDVVEVLLQMGFEPDRAFKLQGVGSNSMRAMAQAFTRMSGTYRAKGERLLKLFAKHAGAASSGQLQGDVVKQDEKINRRVDRTVKAAAAALPSTSEPVPEAPRLEYGTPVRIGRLVSRPELNGARGYILGYNDGRYEIEIGADGAQIRLKPENVDDDAAGGAGDAAIDPRKLRSWRGLGVAIVPGDGDRQDCRPVAWCFQQAMPAGARFSLANQPGFNDKGLAPFAQWVYSLFHIIINWESGVPQATEDVGFAERTSSYRCWRVLLEDEEETENLTIDFLETVRECPPYVPATPPRLPEEAGEVGCKFSRGAPLLPIRYLHNRKSTPSFRARLAAFSKTMPGAHDPVSAHASKRMGCECVVGKVKAASVAEIAAALENLRANETMLSADYQSWFYGMSEQHDEESAFRPSFLVPPMEPKQIKPPPVCAGCDQQQRHDAPKFQQCSRCGTCFCSKACLLANWKEHKKVCRKTEEKLTASASADDQRRGSFLFDLRPPPDMMPYMFNVSMTGAASKAPRKVNKEAPKNIHGAREFMVKVQPPGMASAQKTASCMVYDETRSFQSFMPLATHGVEAVLELIRHYGVHKAGGSKGYFMAKREGTRLRIFTDKIMPPPAW